ncbi:MAG TPA: hypothetical protein VGI03_09100 [Verrucomicrobiae bacterium]|jgi:hypothetical protein
MKKRNAKILAVLAMIVLACTVQANLVLGPTTVDLPQQGGGAAISVDYYVCLSGSTYTYYFVITPPAGSGALSSFTVDISNPAVLSDITSTSSAYVPPPVIDNGESVTWNFSDLTGTATTSFQSQSSPTVLGMSDATSLSGSWVDPEPVPEASTVIAGMLMLLPLSVGIFRALRRVRDINTVPGLSSPVWANVPNANKDVPSGDRRESFLVA